MAIDTSATKGTYVTSITNLFWMPTDSGGIPAVAVSKRDFGYISSVYTILILLIFMIGWKLILAISTEFWPKSDNPDLLSVLDDIRNSGESIDSMKIMASHCKREILNMLGRKPKDVSSVPESQRAQPSRVYQSPDTRPNDNSPPKEITGVTQEEQNQTPENASPSNPSRGARNLWWGLLFLFIALAMSVGNLVAGILVPAQLLMGNVAPVAKDVILYPDVGRYVWGNDTGAGIAKLDLLQAPSALRALGAVELSESAVRKRVDIDYKIDPDFAYLRYGYNVTGVDMGLQSDPKLKLIVNGSCLTDSAWLLNSTDEVDTYRLFGKTLFEVKRQPELELPPTVSFRIDMDTYDESNFSYAIIVQTAGLYSYTSSQDPWYTTDKSGANEPIAYQVRGGRPALSCWETNKWRLNGKDVNIDGLNDSALPGLKLHQLWARKVFREEFSFPRLVTLGRSAGLSALKSASYSSAPFVLDAGASAMSADLERLVMASWISSRDVLRETTRYKSSDLANLAKSSKGSVEAGAAKFVLESGDVATLSVRILISVPAILLFLLILQWSLSWLIRHPKSGENGGAFMP